MSSPRQGDLFQSDEQPELYDDESQTPTWYPDPDEVRAELHKILAEARAAKSMPWDDEARVALSHHLPADDQLRCRRRRARNCAFEFETELERLEAA